jgi:hypothetical protein
MTFEGSAEASVAWESGVVASFPGIRVWIEISLEFQKSKCIFYHYCTASCVLHIL